MEVRHHPITGAKILEVPGDMLVCAVAANDQGPRVAIGPQGHTFDNLALSIAAIAAEATRQHPHLGSPIDLLRAAMERGLPAIQHRTAGGIIVPPGVSA